VDIREFTLERFFARHEFTVKHVIGASDVEPIPMAELLGMADDEMLHAWATLRLGYTESSGTPALRAEIAAMHDLDPAHVRIVAGAQEGILLIMLATLAPGDHAVVVTPAYQSLYELPRAIAGEVTTVALDPVDWSLDLDHVARAMRPNTRIVVVNYPHSPTGALLSQAELDGLVQLCEEREVLLLVDEVYRFLEIDATERLPTAAKLGTHTISLGVLSKAFALAGLRVGWVATRDERLLARIAELRDYTTICGSAPSEILACIALRARDRIIERSRRIVLANLSTLGEFMTRNDTVLSWVPPRAGSVCFPKLREGNADQLAEALVVEEQTLVVPGSHFGADAAHFRLGLGRVDFPDGLARFDRFLSRRR
jgi:aspartate/methionine/tyrosine aminotransferase